MLGEIDRTLERWLRAALPLPSGAGELTFDQPERDWDARRTNPMINLYLYSLMRSPSRATAGGTRLVTLGDGRFARERLSTVVEARYLVSVWGGSAGVEHELLGRLISLLADSVEIPVEHLTDRLRIVTPHPTVSTDPDPLTSVTSLWSGLDVPPRPCVQLVVYSPMAEATVAPAAEPPSSVHLGFSRVNRTAAFAPRRRSFRVGPTSQVTRTASMSIEDSARAGAGERPAVIEIPAGDGPGGDGG